MHFRKRMIQGRLRGWISRMKSSSDGWKLAPSGQILTRFSLEKFHVDTGMAWYLALGGKWKRTDLLCVFWAIWAILHYFLCGMFLRLSTKMATLPRPFFASVTARRARFPWLKSCSRCVHDPSLAWGLFFASISGMHFSSSRSSAISKVVFIWRGSAIVL